MSWQHAHSRVGGVNAAPFVQVAEIWAPRADSANLHLLAGSYGPHVEFYEISRQRSFSPGEGLPGRIWQSGQAVVLNHFRGGSGFLRAEAAARSGLAAGVGFPVFRGGQVAAVVVLLCAGPETARGAFEVWEPSAEAEALRLQSGYYGAFDGFRRVSSAVRFEAGVGLPGRAWKERFPEVLSDVSHSDSFVRAAAAVTYNLSTGLAFPVTARGEVQSVVVVLAARGTPLARAVEIWKPDADRGLVLHAAEYQDGDALKLQHGSRRALGEDLVGRAYAQRFPQVVHGPELLSELIAGDVRRVRVDRGIALPILDGGNLQAIVSLIS